MDHTYELVLLFYMLLVLTYSILAFVNGKGKKTQVRNTVVVFIMVLVPMLAFLFSLAKLYVYFFEPKANNNE